jgi:hypothetical protein
VDYYSRECLRRCLQHLLIVTTKYLLVDHPGSSSTSALWLISLRICARTAMSQRVSFDVLDDHGRQRPISTRPEQWREKIE